MRKICVVTGTRAEYGLLYWTMKEIQKREDLSLQLIVTGMHLSPEFGLTYKSIEKDGFHIDRKIEILLSGDSPVSISKSIGLGTISFSEAFLELTPDLILVLGDRFEILSASIAAMISRTPIAHCHGGEATQGLIDEPIRHSITKMAQIHFTSTVEYKNRVIQMGEQPRNVHNVGALGIENINRLPLLPRDEFFKSVNLDCDEQLLFLVTFHPVTLEENSSEEQINNLFSALDQYPDARIIFTKANADTDGRVINHLIDKYALLNSKRVVVFTSLGQLRYLSALQYVDVVIGNSSSGLIEVPSFKKPTINIGDRQKGRLSGDSVIDCGTETSSIIDAIDKALTAEFQARLATTRNPYGEGNVSELIVDILASIDLSNLVKKEFYDITN